MAPVPQLVCSRVWRETREEANAEQAEARQRLSREDTGSGRVSFRATLAPTGESLGLAVEVVG